jgi:hypothetical protein
MWFSPGTPASSNTESGRHDIAEILLKVALNTKNQSNQSKSNAIFRHWCCLLYSKLGLCISPCCGRLDPSPS